MSAMIAADYDSHDFLVAIFSPMFRQGCASRLANASDAPLKSPIA
jgi:hypothetical protein